MGPGPSIRGGTAAVAATAALGGKEDGSVGPVRELSIVRFGNKGTGVGCVVVVVGAGVGNVLFTLVRTNVRPRAISRTDLEFETLGDSKQLVMLREHQCNIGKAVAVVIVVINPDSEFGLSTNRLLCHKESVRLRVTSMSQRFTLILVGQSCFPGIAILLAQFRFFFHATSGFAFSFFDFFLFPRILFSAECSVMLVAG